jgi:hypothetical protein
MADVGATIRLGIELSLQYNADIATGEFVLEPAGVQRCVR